MSISFNGLASGLDTTSWVESLVALKRAKVTTLTEEQKAISVTRNALNSIRNFFTTFRSTLEKVTDTKFNVAGMDLFAKKIAQVSNSAVISAITTAEAEEGKYNIQVSQLASNTTASSGYKYTTTIVETSLATESSKLTDIGMNTGTFEVTVNGISHSIDITSSDTMNSLINKFGKIGVDADYNKNTGIFSIDISATAINDIGNTGIVDKLHLQSINKGYESNALQTSREDVSETPAGLDTELASIGIGVNSGTIRVAANDAEYDILIEDGDTVQDLLDVLTSEGIDATFKDGIFTLNDAVIVDDGTTGLNTAFGFDREINTTAQTSIKLSEDVITTTAVTATGDTLINDLNGVTAITEGDTVVIEKDSGAIVTVTLSAAETLDSLADKINAVGITASYNEVSGKFDISGGEITGGDYDLATNLDLTKTINDTRVTTNSGTHTLTTSGTSVNATGGTTFADLGFTGNEATAVVAIQGVDTAINITMASTNTLDDFIDALASHGITATLNNGVMSFSGTNGAAIIEGTIATRLGIGLTSSTTTVSNTSTSTVGLTDTTEAFADGNTTLADLGLSGNQNLSVKNSNGTEANSWAFTEDTTLDQIFTTLSDAGVTATINDGVISISSADGKYIDGDLATALGISTNSVGETTTIGSSWTSTASVTYTSTAYATANTLLKDIIDIENLDDCITVYYRSSYGYDYLLHEAFADLSTVTLDDFMSEISVHTGESETTWSINNGVITFTPDLDYHAEGEIIDALGLTATPTTVITGTTGQSGTSSGPIMVQALSTISMDTTMGAIWRRYDVTASVIPDATHTIDSSGNLIAISGRDGSEGTIVHVTTDAQLAAMDGNSYICTNFYFADGLSISDSDWQGINLESCTVTGIDGDSAIDLNITVSSDGDMVRGLFGTVAVSTIKDITVTGQIEVGNSGSRKVGGIVGFLDHSSIEGCNSYVTINDESFSGDDQIDIDNFIGGIVGYGEGSWISKSEFAGFINVDAMGFYSDEIRVGGIIGNARELQIDNCAALGGIRLENSDSTNNTYIGGVAGYITEMSSMEMCLSATSINTNDMENTYYIGNIAGYESATVADCACMYNTGIDYNIFGETTGSMHDVYWFDDTSLPSDYSAWANSEYWDINGNMPTLKRDSSARGEMVDVYDYNLIHIDRVWLTDDSTMADLDIAVSGSLAGGAFTSNNFFTNNTVIDALDMNMDTWYCNYSGTSIQAPSGEANIVLTEDTKLAQLGYKEGDVIEWGSVSNGTQTYMSYTVTSDSTVANVLDTINNSGVISITIANNGTVGFSSSGNSYLTGPEDNKSGSTAGTFFEKLGIDSFGDFHLEKEVTYNHPDSSTLYATTTNNMTENTTFAQLGLASDVEQVVYSNGVESTITIKTTDTVGSFISAMTDAGFSASITDGKFTITGAENTYITDLNNNLDNILHLENKVGEGDAYTSTITNITTNTNSNVLRVPDSVTINGNTLMGDLDGFTEGAFKYVQNGSTVTTTTTISATDSVNDFFNKIAEYGFTGSVDADGKVSVTGEGTNRITGLDTVFKLDSTPTYETETITANTDSNQMLVSGFGAADSTTQLQNLYDKDGNTASDYILNLNGTDYTFSATDTVNDVIVRLQEEGYTASIQDGKFVVTNSEDFTISGGLKAVLFGENIDTTSSGDLTTTYKSSKLSTDEITSAAASTTIDSLLSDYGITGGKYSIYKDGVKQTAIISDSDTFGDLRDQLQSYGITSGLVNTADGMKFVIKTSGDSYIATSGALPASNIAEVLFPDGKTTTYNYSANLTTSSSNTVNGVADKDTLLSDFDPDEFTKSEGSLDIIVDGSARVINVSSNETLGTLMNKFNDIGIDATLKDGKLSLEGKEHDFTIQDTSTSNLVANLGLTYNADMGGYSMSTEEIYQTVSHTEEKIFSVANYANYDTKLKDINISSGTFTLYRDGEKKIINIDESKTLGDLNSLISAEFADVKIDVEDGFLKIHSTTEGIDINLGSNTDTSNIASICGFYAENGDVVSSRQIYNVNGDSVLMTSGLFRTGDVLEGNFKVGNATIEIDDKTTLNDVINQINSSEEANATAYWDSINGKLVLSAKSSGASYINVEKGTGNFTDILGLTIDDGGVERLNTEAQQRGTNAHFTINGTNYTSTSNTITSDISRIKGVTLDLKKVSEGDIVTVEIKHDSESLANTMEEVVKEYNNLIENVDKELAATGNLHDQSSLKFIRNQIRSLMTSTITNNPVYRSLNSVGISLDEASANNIDTSNINRLSFDKDKFMEAYENNGQALKSLIVGTDSDPGVLSKVENVIENALRSVTGYFAVADKSYQSEIKKLDTKIAKANTAADEYKVRLEKKFQNMDRLIAQMQNQYSSFLS